MMNLPSINYRGKREFIKNFNIENEKEKFIVYMKNKNNIVKLFPPFDKNCCDSGCTKIATYINDGMLLCWWHSNIN